MKQHRRTRSGPPAAPRRTRHDDTAAIIHLIRHKRARLLQLERQVMALRREIAVRDSINGGQELPSRGGHTVWPSSITGRARTALQQTRRPTRVDLLLRAVNRLPGPKISAATLVGELARDVRQGGHLFRRTAPGEYALVGERRGRGSLREHEREARELRNDLRVIREAAGGSVAPPRQRRRGRWPRRPFEPSPTSPLGRALAVLRASRQPMRIEHILRAIGRTTGGKVKRRTVESQLSRYVRKGRLVYRTGPAEFTVL